MNEIFILILVIFCGIAAFVAILIANKALKKVLQLRKFMHNLVQDLKPALVCSDAQRAAEALDAFDAKKDVANRKDLEDGDADKEKKA